VTQIYKDKIMENSFETNNRESQFQIELKEIRDKYPDFYIETWTRRDLLSLSEDIDTIEETKFCTEVVKNLYDSYDCQQGTYWDKVLDVISTVQNSS
jgi:hypothetical protein